MSEAAAVRGVVVAHGAMADGLVDAVRQIAGTDDDVLVPVSNRGLSAEGVAERVRARIGTGPVIVFTDLQAGSCAFAARRLSLENKEIAVISGVNLPLLLDFVTHRGLPLGELVPRLLSHGRGSILCAPAELENHGRPAVQGG